MTLKHISLISVPVTDQEKAKDFDPEGNNWLITQEREHA
jgi:hypothetical protein